MRENENSMSVVLLDEFDHCDSETWEAFYHVFDEGESLAVNNSIGYYISSHHVMSCHGMLYHLE